MRLSRNTIIISLMLLSVSVTTHGQRVVKRQQQNSSIKSTPKNNRSQAKVKIDWIEIDDFHEGLAKVVDANGKYGFIDKTGKVVK